MDCETILRHLTPTEGLPREALQAAAERRDDMVPLFLRVIESRLAPSAEEPIEAVTLFFIFHLLGDWKARSAYRPLARLLRLPGNEIDDILGDGMTSTSHRVMAAVYDGDPQPLFDIILDADADEFIRNRMFAALAMVTLRGEADRHQVELFLRDCFMNLRPQAENLAWDGWQEAIAMLGLRELKPLVKKAFDRRYIDSSWLNFEHFEADLKHGFERPGEPQTRGSDDFTLFGDTIEELSTWYGFSEQYEEDRARRRQRDEEEGYDNRELRGGPAVNPCKPAVNPFKGVGRNDPCLCGSGKKFKKCCLQA